MRSGENLPIFSCHFRKYSELSVQSNLTHLHIFLAQKLYSLVKSSSLKFTFLRFSSARVKIRQIPHISFELTSEVLLKFCIIFQSDDT